MYACDTSHVPPRYLEWLLQQAEGQRPGTALAATAANGAAQVSRGRALQTVRVLGGGLESMIRIAKHAAPASGVDVEKIFAVTYV